MLKFGECMKKDDKLQILQPSILWHRRIAAPMVGQSDPPLRTLCLKYGATCVYTEMLYSDLIAHSCPADSGHSYLDCRLQDIDHTFYHTGITGSNSSSSSSNVVCKSQSFEQQDCRNHTSLIQKDTTTTTTATIAATTTIIPDAILLSSHNHHPSVHPYTSRPLVVQLCGHDPQILAEAARNILRTNRVDAIDFNLGCPQDRAKDGLYGSYLLDKCHWPVVFACVRAMVDAVQGLLPIHCKIRICEDGVDNYLATEAFIEGLWSSGASLVCVHGRTRGSAKHRRAGPADLPMISQLARAFHTRLPIVSNGNLVSRGDVATAMELTTPCAGVMSGEGLLRDPALFRSHALETHPLDTPGPGLAPEQGQGPGLEHGLRQGLETHPLDNTPDRCSLFEEYCHLSECFYMAGGWARLETSDASFTSGPGLGPGPELGLGPGLGPGPGREQEQGQELVLGRQQGLETTETLFTSLVIDTITTNTNSRTSLSNPTAPSQTSHSNSTAPGRRKQTDVARAHLFWMLGKTGHGRTVRFQHLGSYKKHVHLLTAVKDAEDLSELLRIAKVCLQGVQGESGWTDDDDVVRG